MGRGIAIVAIGNEVLYGMTLNTNAARIAGALVQNGYSPVAQMVTSDVREDIQAVLSRELLLGRDVITTGGLGPTIDDTTKAAAAHLFSRPLRKNESLFAELASRYGKEYPTLENQSLQPAGAILFTNRVGTAPGFLLEDSNLYPGARLFVLPGPPLEMNDVFFCEVLPRFFPKKPFFTKALHLVGIPEHEVDPILRRLQVTSPNLCIGIYPSYGLVRLVFSVGTKEEVPVLEQAVSTLKDSLPSHLFLEQENSLEEAVHSLLRDRGWKIATAESCTGGGLLSRLTSVSGASEVVSGGVVAYQDFVKESLLGVPSDILEKKGAVSTEVTELMARGAEGLFGVEVVCAVSGFFGPTGGTEASPIGTVCASFLLPNGIESDRFFFQGTRESICERTIQTLLARLFIRLRTAV